ncbi:serglycin [Neosynchiropus ocellatus]
MKLLLASVLLIVVLHSGTGAPRKARYNYVKCNPDGDQANCVTYQSAEINWTPELPSKLPAFTVEYLEANAVEGESRAQGRKLGEIGSGSYEGSGSQSTESTEAFVTMEPELGSGGEEQYRGEREVPEEKELEEDLLLQL